MSERGLLPRVQKLAVFDLDKTLLDDHSVLPEATAARIRAVNVSGVACTIASGRSFSNIEPFMRQLGWLSVPVVAEQGAVVADPVDGHMLLERVVSRDVLLGSVAIVRTASFPLNVILYGDGDPQVFRQPDTPCFIKGRDAGWLAEHIRVVPDDNGIRTGRVRKISVRCPPENTEEVRRLFVGGLGEHAQAVVADAGYIDVMDADVDKGTGLQWLMRHLGIQPEHVMAVGDCEADWSMLRVVGVPVAVGNADAGTQALARYVVPSNVEYGGAIALERFAAGEFGI
jgi:hypothetical protein